MGILALKLFKEILETHEEIDETAEGRNAKIVIRLSALSGLKSNYDFYRLQPY